jgi:hypothetical protein
MTLGMMPWFSVDSWVALVVSWPVRPELGFVDMMGCFVIGKGQLVFSRRRRSRRK